MMSVRGGVITAMLCLVGVFVTDVADAQDKQQLRVPASRVVRFQLIYPNAKLNNINQIKRWKSTMRSSVLASMNFVDEHWLVCGGEPNSKDCGRLQVTGEVVNEALYRINVTVMAKRDPVRNVKGDATSTIYGVLQMGLKGGIFQYTNELKLLGEPSLRMKFDEEFFCFRGALLTGVDKCSLCVAGSYHNLRKDTCEPCPKGTYQHQAGKSNCYPCDYSHTTSSIGATSRDKCMLDCPPGHYLNHSKNLCEPCGIGAYQPLKGQDFCVKCPGNKVTLVGAATASEHCVDNCPAGQQLSLDGDKCETCPKGYYKGLDDVICRRCPEGSMSDTLGATGVNDCSLPSCAAGSYLDLASVPKQCTPCPIGTYQDESGGLDCKPCPEDGSTRNAGASAVEECYSTNQCKTNEHKCHWLAICFDLPDQGVVPRYGCKCKPGFIGNGFDCADVCVGWCFNGGTCIKNSRGAVACKCQDGFDGNRCESSIE